MENPELRDLSVEWVELPKAGSGHWFLRIVQTHGDDSKTEMHLTGAQAVAVASKLGMRPCKSPR